MIVGTRFDTGHNRAQILESIIVATCPAARHPSPERAAELFEQYRGREQAVAVAADLPVQRTVRAAWDHGWTPADLREIARRRTGAAGVRYLDEAIVREAQRYSQPTLQPRWRAELAGMAATVDPLSTVPQMRRRWAATHSVDERAAAALVLRCSSCWAASRRFRTSLHRRAPSRLAFLIAYATRIGERLDATSSSAAGELRSDGRLLPVLAARSQAADEAFNRLFPATVASPLTAHDVVGAGAGRAAADTALLDVREQIASYALLHAPSRWLETEAMLKECEDPLCTTNHREQIPIPTNPLEKQSHDSTGVNRGVSEED